MMGLSNLQQILGENYMLRASMKCVLLLVIASRCHAALGQENEEEVIELASYPSLAVRAELGEEGLIIHVKGGTASIGMIVSNVFILRPSVQMQKLRHTNLDYVNGILISIEDQTPGLYLSHYSTYEVLAAFVDSQSYVDYNRWVSSLWKYDKLRVIDDWQYEIVGVPQPDAVLTLSYDLIPAELIEELRSGELVIGAGNSEGAVSYLELSPPGEPQVAEETSETAEN